MTTSSLYPTHAISCKVPQSSSEFQTQFQPQRPGRFSNASQRKSPIGRWVKIKYAYPFEHGVSTHPVTTNVQAYFLAQLPGEEGNRSGISP